MTIDTLIAFGAHLIALHSGKDLGVLQFVRAANDYGGTGYLMMERLVRKNISMETDDPRTINEILDSRTDTIGLHSGAATEAHTAQLSPRAEVEAIQADTARITEIREEMEAEDEADNYDPEAFYDRRGRIVREDPNADYDLMAEDPREGW